jgi:polysaccharide biosynthesis transport protein
MVVNEEPEGDLTQAFDRVIKILIRRRWIVIGSTCTFALVAMAVLFRIPNRYTSEATLVVTQQQVPERYVVSTSTAEIGQSLDAMAQEVLSRPRLQGIIDELGLYANERARLTFEQLIEKAKRDVSIEPLKTRANAFKISFVADSPELAQAATSRFTTLFIQENLKTRADQATTTTVFLREQLEVAKNKLTEQEQRLRDFKMQYLGELPEQQQGNLGILAGLQSQLDNVMTSRSHAQQQRLYLESLLSEHRRIGRHNAVSGVSSTRQIVTPLEAAQQDLTRLQAEKRTLLTLYTSQHPDVLKKEQEIAIQQKYLTSLKTAREADASNREPKSDSTANTEDDLSVAQLKSQLQANTLEIENSINKEQQLRTEIDQYRSRLNLTPVREQQLTSMQRDYDLLKQHYGDLLKKEQESQLATNLEKRQEGQQFRLADPPNLPTQASSPKRVKISFLALIGGFFAGIICAVLADSRDPSFHAEDDVSKRVALPLVIGIPICLTPREQRIRTCGRVIEWFAACALIVVVAVGELYMYRLG